MRTALLVFSLLVCGAASTDAAERELLPPGPAVESCVECEPVVALTAAQQQLQDYLYVTYPNYLATLAERIQLAEATIDVLTARVEAYRPFRSFHEYSPTWTAEQDTRLALLAARQELSTLRRIEAALPRYHQANVARLTAAIR